MKALLHATDYSSNSVRALKYAATLSLKMNATLVVIHIFDYPTMLDDLSLRSEPPFPDIENEAFEKHTLKLNSFCKEHLGTDVDKINLKVEAIENKSVVKGIISKANEIKPLLIITGMKGGSTVREVIMGNTTKRLIEKSPYPVLSIPKNVSHSQIKTIVYATDFEEEDLGAISILIKIAEPFEAKIIVLHIASSQDKRLKEVFEQKIHKHIKYTNLVVEILNADSVFNDLKIYLGKVNADLIAMLERERKSLSSQVFHRDLVKKMKSYGKVPLISFNAKNYGVFHL